MDKKYINPKAYVRKLRRLLAKLVLSLKIPVQVNTKIDGYVLKFIANSYTEYFLRAQESFRREEVTMYWLREIVGRDETVYDVGANVGAYSLYAGRKVKGGKGGVYAFEPAFSNFLPLCRNIEINSLSDTIIPYPLAFGKTRYETSFFLRSTTTGTALHGLSKPQSEGRQFDPKFRQGISVISIDSFVKNDGVSFPNHIKIDVDGSELEIVEGMTAVLDDARLKSLMIEINSDLSGGKIENIIEKSGMEEVMTEQWKGKNTFNKLYIKR